VKDCTEGKEQIINRLKIFQM